MRVAAVQFKARSTFDAGLHDLIGAIRQARGADLVVAPEMALQGYGFLSHDEVRRVAEPSRGPTFAALSPIAREVGAWVVVGFPEVDGGVLYNSALVIGPDGGWVGTHRKTLLFEADEAWATPGDPSDFQRYDTGKGTFAVGICMDINHDPFLAWCAREEPDVLAFPTNWVQAEGAVWDYWRFRLHRGWPAGMVDLDTAMPDRAPVDAVLVGANSYGREGAHALRGESAILDRYRIYAAARGTGDVVLRAEI